MSKKKLIGIVGACIVVVVAVLIVTNLSAPKATVVTLDDGASISVPRGAVSPDASVNATALDPENGPEPPQGFTIESLYEFDIDEAPTEPVTLRLPLPSIAEDSVCWLAKYDETAGTWHGVAFTVDDDYAVVQTDTLSVYATMTGTWDDFANWARETAGTVGSWARSTLAGLNLDNWISWYEDVMGADEMIYDPLTATSPELECDDSASKGLISASAVLVGKNDIEIRVRNNGKMYLQLYFDGPRVEPVKRGYLALTDILEFVETTPEMKSLVKNSFQTNSVILLPESTADFRAYMNEGESLTIRAELSDAAALLNALDPAFALVPVVDLEVVTAVRDVKGAESDFYQALTAYEGEWMVQTYYALNIVEETLRAGWLFGSNLLKSVVSAYLLDIPTAAELGDESLDRAEDIMDKGTDALSGGTITISYTGEMPTVQYHLTVSSSDGGSVTAPGEGSFTYDAGALVSLVATPASGYTFDRWSGSTSGTASTLAVTMDSDKDVTAHFELEAPPGLIDISPEELVETIYSHDLTSLQREELWISYRGKRVRWTGELIDLWAVQGYPGYGFLGAGTDWVTYWLEEESVIASFDDGYVETKTSIGTQKTYIEIHVAFNEESKSTLLSLPKGSVVTFEGTISYGVHLSGLCGELECSLGAVLRLADSTVVSYS